MNASIIGFLYKSVHFTFMHLNYFLCSPGLVTFEGRRQTPLTHPLFQGSHPAFSSTGRPCVLLSAGKRFPACWGIGHHTAQWRRDLGSWGHCQLTLLLLVSPLPPCSRVPRGMDPEPLGLGHLALILPLALGCRSPCPFVYTSVYFSSSHKSFSRFLCPCGFGP